MSNKLGLVLSTIAFIFTSFLVMIAPASAATVSVKMGSDSGQLVFEPATVSISAGDTVDFVNNKMAPHNVVFSDSGIPSHTALMNAPGEDFAVTFDTPGTYDFVCQPHQGAGMQGKVIVQ